MKLGISDSNINKWARKLEFAITFSHPFGDGNGRTSRAVGLLLSGVELKAEDVFSTFFHRKEESAAILSRLAMFSLFREDLKQDDLDLMKVDTIPDMLQYVFLISSEFKDYGYGTALKGLAWRKTFPEDRLSIIHRKQYQFNTLGRDQDTRLKYEKELEKIQTRLFWKAQEILDTIPDREDLRKFLEAEVSRLK